VSAPTGPVRTLVVWCPDWPVVAAGAAPGEPAVVVHANRVVAATPAARAEGVDVGLRRREAQARCPGLVVHAADPARDARAFEPVVAALEAVLTPGIELTRPGSCAFATRGPSRYFGGDEALAARAGAVVAEALGRAVGGIGPAAVAGGPRVGIADGPFAAAQAARRASTATPEGARVAVVPPGGAPAFLAPLPVDVLERPALTDLLVRLGITTLGALAALPAADVAARFGPEGAEARRLAAGEDARPPGARRPPPDLAVAVELDPPALQVEQAAFAARPLADELHARLGAQALACTRLLVEAETEHDEVLGRLWRHEGALSAAAIAERVRWQLDGWLRSPTRPTGGITWLRLVPDEVVPDQGTQLGFWGGRTERDERAVRAMARLEGLLGPEGVAVPARRGGRSPAEQAVAVPAGTVTAGEEARPGPWPGRIPAPWPATVHVPPPEVAVHDAAGRPVGVSGRGVVSAPPTELLLGGGRAVAVAAWAGPWPVEERWWDPATRRRCARLQVVTADGAAHLLALEGGRWWLEATYD